MGVGLEGESECLLGFGPIKALGVGSGMQDPSFLTGSQTQAPCSGNAELELLCCHELGIPNSYCFKRALNEAWRQQHLLE